MNNLDPKTIADEIRGKQYPLSIRDVSPHSDAVRLTGVKPDGIPDGVHTGGAWAWGEYVFKPLDGRPYANCPYHYSTLELEALIEMEGAYLFPHNWWIEKLNGRYFLVRLKSHIFGPDLDFTDIRRENLLSVEQSIRLLNAKGWEVNDDISLALHPKDYDLFVSDLSAVQRMDGTGAYAADDEDRMLTLFERCGQSWIAKVRRKARSLVKTRLLRNDEGIKGRHAYGSMYRPMDALWAGELGRTYGATYIQHKPNLQEADPHTWIVTPEPLPPDVIRRFDLTWGWSPVETKIISNFA